MGGEGVKTALYVEDGVVQIVLTPEKDAEKGVLAILQDELKVTVYRGSFYSCQGGWVRQGDFPPQGCWNYEDKLDDKSLIIVVKNAKPEQVEQVVTD